MRATCSRFPPISKKVSITSRAASPMGRRRAPCRSCSAATIRSDFRACAASRNALPNGSASFISTGTSISRKKTSTNACTPRLGTGRQIFPMFQPRTLSSSASAAGRSPVPRARQLGIGGWQVPRSGVQEARKRATNVLTIADIEKLGLEKTAEIALDLAWKDADAVYVSFDVDSVDGGFVPGTGWPEPGGFLPREALKLLGLVAGQGVCGLEVVEVSPPYDTSDITALVGVRVVVEVLGSLVAHGKPGGHKHLIDNPVTY